MVKDAMAPVLDEVGDQFKARCAPVVGIRDFVMFMVPAEIGEGADFCPGGGIGSEGEDLPAVEVVHGQDEIEAFEIPGHDLPGCARDPYPTSFESFPHTLVRRIARVGIDRASGVAANAGIGFIQGEEGTEHVFSRGRAADVSPADKEDMEGPDRWVRHVKRMIPGKEADKAAKASGALNVCHPQLFVRH